MIDDRDYPQGTERPALKPDSIGYPKKNATVLTIADVDPKVEIPDGDGNRTVLVVIFREFPDLTFYTNKTSRNNLIAALGRDENKWRGKKVPLVVVKVNNPKTGKPQPSLWVADPEEWATHLKKGRK